MISVHAVELRADEIERLGRLAENPGPMVTWENAVARMVDLKNIMDEKEMDMNGKKGNLGKFMILSGVCGAAAVIGGDSSLSTLGLGGWLVVMWLFLFLKIRSLYKDRIHSIIVRLIIGYFLVAITGSVFFGIGRSIENLDFFGKLIPVIAAVVSFLIINSNKMKKSGAYNRAKIEFQAAEREEQAAWDQIDKVALVLLPEGYRSSAAAAAAYQRLRNGCRTMEKALDLQ